MAKTLPFTTLLLAVSKLQGGYWLDTTKLLLLDQRQTWMNWPTFSKR